MNITQRIYETGIIPVVKLDRVEDAEPLAKALIAGGLNCAEITFRTDAAEEAIARITKAFPNMLVGAGTVLTTDQVDRAVAAGAKFIVSPGFNRTTAEYCVGKNIPIFPGCPNAGSIEQALELGLTDLKFFPAEQSGGLAMIKALSGPFTKVRFIPTGGINENNLNEYLSNGKVLACGGSWMVKDTLIKEGKFDEIERITRDSVNRMLGFELRHVGVNCENEEAAQQEAKKMCALFGLAYKPGNSSVFSGVEFEFMKKMYLGKNGHIAMAVNSVDRAYAYLSAQGYEFLEETVALDDSGRKKFAYLKDEIGGFAIHLIQK